MPTPALDNLPLDRSRFDRYWLDNAYDEMYAAPSEPRAHYRGLHDLLRDVPLAEMRRRKQAADVSFLHQGITFTVYGRDEGAERIFPHDLLPRIVTSAEWATIERGLAQRITALNLFLKDIYNEGRRLGRRRRAPRHRLFVQVFPASDARISELARHLYRRHRH